jgi:hypothetical protein
MGSYPYPGSTKFPDALADYLLEWNTREVSNESQASYRTEYRAVAQR